MKALCLSIQLIIGYAACGQSIFSGKINYSLQQMEGYAINDYFFLKTRAFEGGAIVLYAINPTKNLFYNYKLIRDEDLSLKGYSVNENEINLFLQATDDVTSKMECITFSTKFDKFVQLKEHVPVSKVLSYASYHSKFYSLSLDKKDRKLLLHELKSDTVSCTAIFPIDQEDVYKNFIDRFFTFHLDPAYSNPSSKKGDYTFIEDGVEIPFDRAMDQGKIYFKDDKILLISDNWKGEKSAETLVMELDISHQTSSVKMLPLPFDRKADHNSFFYNDRLFVMGTDETHLAISVFNYPSFEKIGEQTVIKGELIKLKASPLIERAEYDYRSIMSSKPATDLDKKWSKELNKYQIAQKTIQTLNKGLPLISVSEENSNYRLLIGAKEQHHYNQHTPLRPNSLQQNSLIKHIPNSTYSYSFYGYLKKSDLEVPSDIGLASSSRFERTNDRLKELKSRIKLGACGTISSKKGVYLVYTDKKTKTLFVEEFK